MPITELEPFYDMNATNEEPFSSEATLYFDNQFQTLDQIYKLLSAMSVSVVSPDNNVTLNGLVAPSFSTSDITSLASDPNNPLPAGTMWYNTTTKKLNYLKEYVLGVPTISEIQSIP